MNRRKLNLSPVRGILFAITAIMFLLGCETADAQIYTHPKIVEIITKSEGGLKNDILSKALYEGAIPPPLIYNWKNHTVIYGDVPDTTKLLKSLSRAFPSCRLKLYSRPFYTFSRKNCSGSTIANAWTNIILTANLVAAPKLQQEYLNYHATQFEKWPEVSQGFCNASFQQLLVFKNGRQLMLIISIPKGESLDKLNPLTTKDNPRVNEWNKIMAKYQEGIEGTKKGETWVFLNKVK